MHIITCCQVGIKRASCLHNTLLPVNSHLSCTSHPHYSLIHPPILCLYDNKKLAIACVLYTNGSEWMVCCYDVEAVHEEKPAPAKMANRLYKRSPHRATQAFQIRCKRAIVSLLPEICWRRFKTSELLHLHLHLHPCPFPLHLLCANWWNSGSWKH
jgi:hypothetical protein